MRMSECVVDLRREGRCKAIYSRMLKIDEGILGNAKWIILDQLNFGPVSTILRKRLRQLRNWIFHILHQEDNASYLPLVSILS